MNLRLDSELGTGSRVSPSVVWFFLLGLICCSMTSCTGQPSDHSLELPRVELVEPAFAHFKVVNWNVLYGFNHGNSIDAGTQWIAGQSPDVVALQELNGNTSESLKELGQCWQHDHAVILKEKGFPVGLTSSQPIELIERGVDGFHHGFLHCKTHGIHFFVVHFWPTKGHEAVAITDKIKPLLADGQRVVVLGDFNTHSRKDETFLLTKKKVKPLFDVVDLFESIGLVDLVYKHDPEAKISCPSPITIPKWSADLEELESKRQRIDFILGDSAIAKFSTSGKIVITDEIENISDHYPVVVDFRLPDKGE